MSIGTQLQKLRKEKGLSQEELADMLGVSRQSVSKWEMDSAYPETEKLIKLSALYQVTIDSLINPDHEENMKSPGIIKVYPRFHYEYKSRKTLFGLPLVHVNIGQGFYVSKGIISVGNISLGVLSIGILSIGLISIGVLGIGFVSFGAFALALFLACGSFAFGTVAVGAIAFGLFSAGAISVGFFSCGALSVAKYVAYGDHAQGFIAIGKTQATGQYTFLPPYDKQAIFQVIDAKIPPVWRIFIDWIKNYV